jgi:hypothetical protein
MCIEDHRDYKSRCWRCCTNNYPTSRTYPLWGNHPCNYILVVVVVVVVVLVVVVVALSH